MNTMSQTLSGPELAASSGQATHLVVMLHGVGADGHDLISLAPILARTNPGAHFCSPNAPFPYDMAPYGNQWFSLQERTMEKMLAGVEQARPILDAYLDDKLQSLGLTDDKLIVIGFSQGTMTALHVMPRRSQACAGIIGFSGAMVASSTLSDDIASYPPVCLIHGDSDVVVPLAGMADAEAALRKAGVEVEAHTRPGLGHGIDEQGLATAIAFLDRVTA